MVIAGWLDLLLDLDLDLDLDHCSESAELLDVDYFQPCRALPADEGPHRATEPRRKEFEGVQTRRTSRRTTN